MKIEINITKLHLYILLTLIVLFSGLLVVIAAFEETGAWHGANEIRVTIGGEPMSLQDALDGPSIRAAWAEDAAHADDADTVEGFDLDSLDERWKNQEVSCSGWSDAATLVGGCGQAGCGNEYRPRITYYCVGGVLTSMTIQCYSDTQMCSIR